jgi:acyl-CoA dehydrogenase
MTDEFRLLAETVTHIFERSPCLRADGSVDAEHESSLWDELRSLGLLGVGIPEASGGSGGDLAAAAFVARTCARFVAAAALPISGGLLVSNWLRLAAGWPVSFEPTAVAYRSGLRLQRSGSGRRLNGTADRVMWAPSAKSMLLVLHGGHEPTHVVAIDPQDSWSGVSVIRDPIRATLPLGHVSCDGVPLADHQVRVLPSSVHEAMELRLAMLATVQIAGLLEEVLRLTVEYAYLRRQFGRAISDFQMVKDKLVLLAGEVTAAATAADVVATTGSEAGALSEVPLRAARLRASYAATSAARLAHQIHGTIGLTAEYPLHVYTTQLWHWRDAELAEFDNEVALGRLVASNEPESLWAAVVSDGV